MAALWLMFSASCTQKIDHRAYEHPEPATIDTNLILPPAWAFGVLYGGYTDQEGTIQRIKEIKAHDYPIDAYWIDSWFWSFGDEGVGPHKYIDFVADTIGFPDRQEMWHFMEENNIKGGFWVWDCIQRTGNEKAFDDFNEKGYFSSTYVNKNSWHNQGLSTAMFQENKKHPGTLTGNIDFDNPEAVSHFKERMKHFFDEGADFIKLDRTSKISVCKVMFEMSQEYGKETHGRGFVLSHTGGMESEEYKKYPIKWTDDTRSDWNIEQPALEFNDWVPRVSFKENIAMYTDTSQKTSKIPFLTNDLGGFDMGITDLPNEELYIRWLQFSMMGPITEVFSQPENPTANMAWLYSERADTIFRFYAHLRMELFPYLYSYAHHSRLTGENMIRKIPGQLYEFMLGNELLVAPVYEKGAITRKVGLPEGKWINYWTGELLQGGMAHVVAAPIQQIPLFIRQGSIIPMRRYASSIEKGNNDTLYLNIYPGTDATFSLIEDDGTSNDYLQGIYASTHIESKTNGSKLKISIEPVLGDFKGMKDSRTWILHIHDMSQASSVSAKDIQILKNYNDSTKVLTIDFSSSKGKSVLIEIDLI
jgi:alpha-glucosidase (family GH31 glycosyl hydrolase)